MKANITVYVCSPLQTESYSDYKLVPLTSSVLMKLDLCHANPERKSIVYIVFVHNSTPFTLQVLCPSDFGTVSMRRCGPQFISDCDSVVFRCNMSVRRQHKVSGGKWRLSLR